MTPRIKAYSYLLTATFIWAFASVVIKTTLNGIDPIPFLTYRFFIASIAALPFFGLIIRGLKRNSGNIIIILIYSLLSTTISLGLLFLGLDKTTVLNSILITLATPILIEYAGVIFLKEHITKREKIGTAIALAGTLLTVIEPLFDGNTNLNQTSGNILIFSYLTADIISVILLKKLLRKGIGGEFLTHFSFLIGFISILPFAFILTQGKIFSIITHLPFKYHIGVVYMALFSGTIAYILRAKGQKTIEVSEAALFTYLTNTFSVPMAVFILKESVPPQFFLGAFFIIIGVFIAEKKHISNH